MNGPGIAGLLAGVEWLAGRGIDAMHAREAALKARLRERLAAVPGVHLRSPPAPEGVGIVTFTLRGTDPALAAGRLDREHGVLCRAGLHCAPESHALLGTLGTGALRFSVGWATTEAEVDRAAEAVRRVAAETSEGHRG